jgi:hypothetical protein
MSYTITLDPTSYDLDFFTNEVKLQIDRPSSDVNINIDSIEYRTDYDKISYEIDLARVGAQAALPTSVTFDDITLTGMAGPMVWNETEATVDFPVSSDVTLQVGQEFHIYGKAIEPILNGQPVIYVGAQGGHILIKVADGTDTANTNPERILGLATQDFATNEFGYVTTKGKVNGIDTSAFNEGDVLYLSNTVPGELSTTFINSTEYHEVVMGVVLRTNPAQGTIKVLLEHVRALDEVAGVSATNPQNKDILCYRDSTNQWVNSHITVEALGRTNVPVSSIGVAGDKEGHSSFDSTYLYICTADYDGVTNIWKRILFLADTW